MEFSFDVRSVLKLTYHKENKRSEVNEVELGLVLGGGLDQSVYIDKDGYPTGEGQKAITSTLIAGLTANIKAAHQSGHWDEVEHIKYAIDHLQRGFVTHATAEQSIHETPDLHNRLKGKE